MAPYYHRERECFCDASGCNRFEKLKDAQAKGWMLDYHKIACENPAHQAQVKAMLGVR